MFYGDEDNLDKVPAMRCGGVRCVRMRCFTRKMTRSPDLLHMGTRTHPRLLRVSFLVLLLHAAIASSLSAPPSLSSPPSNAQLKTTTTPPTPNTTISTKTTALSTPNTTTTITSTTTTTPTTSTPTTTVSATTTTSTTTSTTQSTVASTMSHTNTATAPYPTTSATTTTPAAPSTIPSTATLTTTYIPSSNTLNTSTVVVPMSNAAAPNASTTPPPTSHTTPHPSPLHTASSNMTSGPMASTVPSPSTTSTLHSTSPIMLSTANMTSKNDTFPGHSTPLPTTVTSNVTTEPAKVHCNFSQLCANQSVYYWMVLAVDVTGDLKIETDISDWLWDLFHTHLDTCEPYQPEQSNGTNSTDTLRTTSVSPAYPTPYNMTTRPYNFTAATPSQNFTATAQTLNYSSTPSRDFSMTALTTNMTTKLYNHSITTPSHNHGMTTTLYNHSMTTPSHNYSTTTHSPSCTMSATTSKEHEGGNMTAASLFQDIEVTCVNKTRIRRTNCTVLLKLRKPTFPCCVQRAIWLAAENSPIRADIVGNRVGKGLSHCAGQLPPVGSAKCNGSLNGTLPLPNTCQFPGSVNISCGHCGTVYVPLGNQTQMDDGKPPKPPIEAKIFCNCFAYCDGTAARYTLDVQITDSALHISNIFSLVKQLRHPPPCHNTSATGPLLIISTIFQCAYVKCFSTETNLQSCRVIVGLGHSVPICAVSTALMTVFSDERGIDYDGKVTRAGICSWPGSSGDLLNSTLSSAESCLNQSEFWTTVEESHGKFVCKQGEVVCVLPNEMCDRYPTPPLTSPSPIASTTLPPTTTRSPPPNTTLQQNTTSLPLNTTLPPPNSTSTAPNTTTSAPNTTTSAPNTTTSAPNTTTSAPNTTTSAPNTTTSAPNTTTSAPNTTTSAPNTTTSAPNTTTSAPNTTTSAPNTTTSAPNTTTSAPNTTTSAPNTTTSAPNTTTSAPNTTTSAANTTTSAPNTTTSAPNTTTSAPNTTTSAPNTTTSAPNTTTSAPNTTTSAPNTTTSAPNTTTSAPNTTTSAPNTTTSAPNTTTSAPNTTTSAPNTTTSAPNTTTSAPNTTTSAPNTTTSAPSTIVTTQTNTMTTIHPIHPSLNTSTTRTIATTPLGNTTANSSTPVLPPVNTSTTRTIATTPLGNTTANSSTPVLPPVNTATASPKTTTTAVITTTAGNHSAQNTTEASNEEQANQLLDLTSDVSKLNSSQVDQLVSQLEALLAGPNVSLALGKTSVTIVSNLLGVSSDTLASSSTKIIGIVDTVGLKLVVQEEATILTESVALAVKTVDGTDFQRTSFSIRDPNSVQIRGDNRARRSVRAEASSLPQGSITFPSSLTANLSPEQQLQASRLQFNFYQKSTVFQDRALGDSKLNSGILGASVANLSIKSLHEDVVITLRNTEPVLAHFVVACVFWDFGMNDGSGGWNRDGCSVRNSTDNETVCVCNHLTCFGVLLDMSRTGITSLQATILTYITYIGCGISAIFLSVTLLTYLAFGKLRKDIPSKILIQLCVALLFLNLVFLVDGWLALYPDAVGLCISTAWFLHYFLLASFTWMGLEAVHMYLALVKVFNTYIPRYMLKFSLLGWGTPLLVVIVVIAVDEDNYGLVGYGKYVDGSRTDDFCWLKNDIAFYVSVVAYFCVIFLMNLVMFAVVMVQLCRIKRQNPDNKRHRNGLQDLRSVVGVTVLLGLTWGFAFFAWGPVNLPFMYLFCIFNSFQGFFIFVFHCAVKENVRRQWRTYLCCGRLRLAENSEWSRTATQKTGKKSLPVTRATSLHSDNSSQFNNSSIFSFLSNDSSERPSGGIGSPFDDRSITALEVPNSDVVLNEINSQFRSPSSRAP
ncbi:mucin-5AC-like isoform X1 [Oncorhynchus nerka]|uniref:mucin-5AC-like isoform X1 n=1 Tax=Oncorhynchus nerka TaxID=8023 RepID=UPI0031B80557